MFNVSGEGTRLSGEGLIPKSTYSLGLTTLPKKRGALFSGSWMKSMKGLFSLTRGISDHCLLSMHEPVVDFIPISSRVSMALLTTCKKGSRTMSEGGRSHHSLEQDLVRNSRRKKLQQFVSAPALSPQPAPWRPPFPSLSSRCHFHAPFLTPSPMALDAAQSSTVVGTFVFHVLCTGSALASVSCQPFRDWVSEADAECSDSKGILPTLNCLSFP